VDTGAVKPLEGRRPMPAARAPARRGSYVPHHGEHQRETAGLFGSRAGDSRTVGRVDVIEVPDALPNIVGRIRWKIRTGWWTCGSRKLIPNPEHENGELCNDF
jgi:hypothetical protein